MGIFLLLLVFVLLLFSALLSMAETSITAISTAKIHKLKTDGNKQAAIISKLRENKESLISTILLVNNVCNIFSSSLATAVLIEIFGGEGVIYATLIMTILIIIFSEILPKTYAITNPEQVALMLARFLQIAVQICYPFTKAINFIVTGILKLFRIHHAQQQLISATDEIKGAIQFHHQEGGVDQSNKFMLDGVFYLGETKVKEVMTHRKNMKTIDISLSKQEIAKQIKEIKHRCIPVWQDKKDNIIGILNTRDFLYSLLNQNTLQEIDIAGLLTQPMFIHEHTPLDEQLAEFKEQKTRIAIVIDEYGDIQGIITLSDILEEVVGRFQDKYDSEKDDIIFYESGCIVNGQVPVRDLNRMLNWSLPDKEASTIAGLLIFESERIPEVNEVLNLDNFKFTVVEKENNQLTRIKIEQI